MRFFDEDNRQFEWTVGVILMTLVLYLGSYVVLRAQHTSPCEEDGCWYERVDMPQNGLWIIYRPLMMIDHKYFRAKFTSN